VIGGGVVRGVVRGALGLGAVLAATALAPLCASAQAPGRRAQGDSVGGTYDFSSVLESHVLADGMRLRVNPIVRLERGPGGLAKLTLVRVETTVDSLYGLRVGRRRYAFSDFGGELWQTVKDVQVTALKIVFVVERPGALPCDELTATPWLVGAGQIYNSCPIQYGAKVVSYQILPTPRARTSLTEDLGAKVKAWEAAGRKP
jgi:hypothetical protein